MRIRQGMPVMSGMLGRTGSLPAQAVHTHTQTNANLSEYVVYSVSINVMSDVFSNVKSGHRV